MSKGDQKINLELFDGLEAYEANVKPLPGISREESRSSFIQQLLDSIHRVKYPSVLKLRKLSPENVDPNSSLFDPIKGAIVMERMGQFNEACWLVFLFVHFGKNIKTNYGLTRAVYGALGGKYNWDWEKVSANPGKFQNWLQQNKEQIKKHGSFGNHRKYLSLDAFSDAGTGKAFLTYVAWVRPPRDHRQMLDQVLRGSGNDTRRGFAELYKSMSTVASFGRMARFDYLTMLGKLGLANIEPGSPFLAGATGPVKGAKQLFGNVSTADLEKDFLQLDTFLHVGMQVLEDAICNWQKSTDQYVPFRG